jgi:hypothetical protein
VGRLEQRGRSNWNALAVHIHAVRTAQVDDRVRPEGRIEVHAGVKPGDTLVEKLEVVGYVATDQQRPRLEQHDDVGSDGTAERAQVANPRDADHRTFRKLRHDTTQPPRHPPVGTAHQAHAGGDHDHAHDRRVEQHTHRQSDADFFDRDNLSRSERTERADENQSGGCDYTRGVLESSRDRLVVAAGEVKILFDA